MATVNENYLKLQAGYLFPEIGKRRRAFQQSHPEAKIISMGIGDVTQPLPAAVIEAMHKAVVEMGNKATFRGYDDGGIGYDFLREAIRVNDFSPRGVEVDIDEIFIRNSRSGSWKLRTRIVPIGPRLPRFPLVCAAAGR